MNELQPIIDWLMGKWPWLAGVMATARVFAKPISGILQSGLTKLALYALATPEEDDDLWVKRIVTNKAYRFVAFLLDWILSIKLPTEASLAAVMAGEVENSKPEPPTIPPISMWLLCGLLSLWVFGCSTPQRPPTPAEQKYFTVQTNIVEVVAWVTNRTEATETTPAAIRVEPVTNRVEEYDFVPNANAGALASTGAAVTSIWSPAAGGAVGAAITGIFGLWGLLRSKKRETANELTALELAQIIETGRQILLKTQDGAKYEAAWKNWMVKHQAETGVISQVAQLVAAGVDNDKAKGAAQTIVNLIEAQPR